MASPCTICTSTFRVAPHHHPRRSAGVFKFPMVVIDTGNPVEVQGTPNVTIEKDDPRRIFLVCGLCHSAIHNHHLLLDRWRDGLHFTLDKVEESPSARDSDLVMDITREPPECIWRMDYYDGDLDSLFSQVVDENRGDVESILSRVKDFLYYAQPEHWEHLIVEIAELGTRQMDRLRTYMRVNYYDQMTFRWGQDGKPINDQARKKIVAERFGVSVTTVNNDLSIARFHGLEASLGDDRTRSTLLLEAEQSRQDSDKSPECPDGPGGKHWWRITGKKCRVCGEEK